ncbi:MAG: PEP-CTERM/exosortase system-associated acyltransferase [Xenococcaceae cyanobacterium MO_188.B29]|nr:PEP-CTERM/exosortase system-associated acyltransferase [Xenococcaceae cyanobacterium MO_188.B29]
MSNNITEHFFSYFDLYIADTPKLKEEVYKIRYQVYCDELNYEPKENFPEGMETDIYDSRSIHCLLKHKPSGLYAGCVRLVLADLEKPKALFPLEKVCQHSVDFSRKSRLHYSEVSRLAVISQFRKRKGEQNSATGLILPEQDLNPSIQEKRKFPVIALSLYLACTSILITLNLDDTFTMMEARLSRHMRIFGIPSQLVGDFIEYHGRRGPFLMSPTSVLDNINEDIRDLFENIHSQLKPSVDIHPLVLKYRSLYSHYL